MQQLLPERFRVYRAEGELIGLRVWVCVAKYGGWQFA